MRRALCVALPPKLGSLVSLDDTEAKHLTSVLRLGPDDEIELLDGSGARCRAKLVFREKKLFAEMTGPHEHEAKLTSLPIHLVVSIIKGDAMEWVIEKAVEMGARSLTPIETEFTVVKTQKRGADTFQERWQRIADQALKQSGRLDRMKIHSPILFEEAFLNSNHLIWLDETLAVEGAPENHLCNHVAGVTTQKDFSLLIGPEGGFSPSERSRLLQLTGSRNHEITRAHLGSIILRAETASLMALSMLVGMHYGKRKN